MEESVAYFQRRAHSVKGKCGMSDAELPMHSFVPCEISSQCDFIVLKSMLRERIERQSSALIWITLWIEEREKPIKTWVYCWSNAWNVECWLNILVFGSILILPFDQKNIDWRFFFFFHWTSTYATCSASKYTLNFLNSKMQLLLVCLPFSILFKHSLACFVSIIFHISSLPVDFRNSLFISVFAVDDLTLKIVIDLLVSVS